MENCRYSRINGEIIFYIYVVVFTIGPSFTKVLGQPISRIATILAFIIILFLNANKIRRCPKLVFFGISIMIILKAIPYLANGESARILVEIIEVFLPLILFSFVFRNFPYLIEKVITIVIVTSAIICVFGLIEEFTQFNVFSLIENYQFENYRLGTSSTFRFNVFRIEQGFNTSLTYELYLVMCMGLTFYRMLSNQKRMLYIVILLLQSINCLFTMSRGITFVLICGVFGIVVLNRKEIKIRYVVLVAMIIMIGSLVFVQFHAGLFAGIGDGMDSIVSILSTGTGGANDDNSIMDRQYYQGRAIEALEDPRNVLFGVGESGLRSLRTIDNNWLLEITAFGVFGLLSFALLTLFPFYDSFRKWIGIKKNEVIENDHTQLIFYRCMMMTFLVYILSLFTVAQMEEARLFYLLVCLSYYYPNSQKYCRY